MNTTTNLGLKKPGLNDAANIEDLNGNMDTLDAKIGAVGNISLQGQLGNSPMGTTATTVTGAIAEHEQDLTTQSQAITALNSNIAMYGCERVNFYGFTLGTAKSITAKSYNRIGYAMGVFATNPDSRFIIPFSVVIPANSDSLTITQIVLSGSADLITVGTYDVALFLFRAM